MPSDLDRRIAVVIPAHDELPSLQDVVPRLNTVLDSLHGYVFGVYVVTEMQPSEHTIQFLKNQRVTLVKRYPTNSFGDAIRCGIEAVPESFERTIIMDADGSHFPETIPRLLATDHDFDVVVASRYVDGGSSDNGAVLRWMSRSLNWTYALVLNINCNDISTNFKLYRTSDLKAITLTSTNFDLVEEILIRLAQRHHPKKLRILEIPDHFAERIAGVSKRKLSLFIASYIFTLLRFKVEAMRNR